MKNRSSQTFKEKIYKLSVVYPYINFTYNRSLYEINKNEMSAVNNFIVVERLVVNFY